MSIKNKKNLKADLSEIKSSNINPGFPSIETLTKDEIIEIYKEEIKKKDKRIAELETDNRLLLELTMKNAKRRLEELETKINEN